jgi:flagellar M-ring protein FliF
MAETALPALPQNLKGLKDLPFVRQLALLIGIAGAVAGGIAMFTWSQQPGYVGLYGDLTGKDAADAAEALRAANIPVKLDPSGTLMVPGAQVHEARLQLASLGLPKGGAQGFEMMQQDPGFGVSSFLEGARYNHALETELARSIGLLSPVKAARVHLAIPKQTAFARPGEGASASVLVELHNGQALEQNQVQAIVHMVGSSVPDLDSSRVTVIDQFGRLLSRNGSDQGLAITTEQFDHARRVEADYARRVEQLLAPITGPGKVSTQVSADLDFDQTEEAHESYAPDKSVVKQEQTSQESTRGPGSSAQGVPGALSNQPPQATPQLPVNALTQSSSTPAVDAPINESKSSSRNYEVDRTLSHTREAVGRIKRLSIAVLVDDLPRADKDGNIKLQPLSADELKKVETLVKDAVGFDEARGDRVTVQNVSFLPPTTVEATETPIWQQPQAQNWARQVFGLLAIIVLVFAVIRPTLKSLLTTPRAAALSAPAQGFVTGSGAAGAIGADPRRQQMVQEELPPGVLPAYEQKLQVAKTAVAQDPKKVAQVVKSWLGEEGAA